MDVDFMPSMNFPRTSSNPGEIGAVELGYRTVMGFSQIDSAPGECGAVELDFRRASVPPGESGEEDCDYIRPAVLILIRSSRMEISQRNQYQRTRDRSSGGAPVRRVVRSWGRLRMIDMISPSSGC